MEKEDLANSQKKKGKESSKPEDVDPLEQFGNHKLLLSKASQTTIDGFKGNVLSKGSEKIKQFTLFLSESQATPLILTKLF